VQGSVGRDSRARSPQMDKGRGKSWMIWEERRPQASICRTCCLHDPRLSLFQSDSCAPVDPFQGGNGESEGSSSLSQVTERASCAAGFKPLPSAACCF
jgi:hypothetical protein